MADSKRFLISLIDNLLKGVGSAAWETKSLGRFAAHIICLDRGDAETAAVYLTERGLSGHAHRLTKDIEMLQQKVDLAFRGPFVKEPTTEDLKQEQTLLRSLRSEADRMLRFLNQLKSLVYEDDNQYGIPVRQQSQHDDETTNHNVSDERLGNFLQEIVQCLRETSKSTEVHQELIEQIVKLQIRVSEVESELKQRKGNEGITPYSQPTANASTEVSDTTTIIHNIIEVNLADESLGVLKAEEETKKQELQGESVYGINFKRDKWLHENYSDSKSFETMRTELGSYAKSEKKGWNIPETSKAIKNALNKYRQHIGLPKLNSREK